MRILNSAEDMGPGALTFTADRKSRGRGIWDNK